MFQRLRRGTASLSIVSLAMTVCLALAVPTVEAQGRAGIEGTRWISIERSAGGLGLSYTFLQGGDVVENSGAMIDFSYRVSGDVVALNVAGQERQYAFAIQDQSMTLRDQDGREQRYRRAGPRASKPELHGLWTFTHETGAPADIFFDGAGHGLMRVLMQARRGTFSSRPDGRLLIDMGGGEARSATLDGDVMEMRWAHKVLRLKRG